MKLIKYKLFLITALFLVSSCLTGFAVAQENINNFDVDISINKDGTIDVTENILYSFGTYEKHGIFRYIPYGKTNQQGEKFNMKISEFSVKDEDGNKYDYDTSSNLSDQINTIKIGDPDKYVTGVKTYVIKYKVSGALTYFSEHDELYWNLTGNDWPVPILNSSVKITLPPEASDIKIICYTGALGESQNECVTNVSKNEVYLKSSKILYPGEGWTMAVSFPKEIVQVLEPARNNTDLIFKILTYIFLAILSLFMIWWYLVYPIRLLLMWLNAKKQLDAARITSAWFDPPKRANNELFTPAETSVIANRNFDNKLISAQLISWAQKGYIKITEEKKNEFKLIKLKDIDFVRSIDKKLESAFFAGKDMADLKALSKTISFSTNIEEVKKSISKSLVEEKIFAKDSYTFDKKYAGIAATSFVFLNIFAAILASMYKKMAPLTNNGLEKYGEAKSLLNFLTSQNEQLNFQSKNQLFFEKLLPYATAFGVENIWMDRFKDINIVQPEWYQGSNYSSFVHGGFSSGVRSSVSKSYAMSSTSSSRGFSSGSSGGSSGGGGGGGGGGSW